MSRFALAFFLLLGPPGAREVSFAASDKLVIKADLYEAKNAKTAPVLLLFHQAGSNAAEYNTIAPRLAKNGFNCLAPDLR